MDILGQIVRKVSKYQFKGKGKLLSYWMNNRDKSAKRTTTLSTGGKILCDFNVPYEAMVWLGYEEPYDLLVINQLLYSGMTFVDCGANIGLYSIMAGFAVGESGKVFAFEPNPKTANKLLENIKRNNLTNINISESAVGSVSTEVFFKCEEAHNVSSITASDGDSIIKIPVVVLDEYLNNQPVHGIKIDVEGYELEVLKGARNTLIKFKPWLSIEFNTLVVGISTLGDWDVHQYLTSVGYSPCLMKNALREQHERLKDNWSTSGYCNLLYLPC